MLRCIIEIVPLSNENNRYEIERLEVINDLSHPKRPEYGNYRFYFKDYPGVIKNHKRRDGAIALIKKVLNKIPKELL